MVGTADSDRESNDLYSKKGRKRSGKPKTETRLGEQQQRRVDAKNEKDSLQRPGFTRWAKT